MLASFGMWVSGDRKVRAYRRRTAAASHTAVTACLSNVCSLTCYVQFHMKFMLPITSSASCAAPGQLPGLCLLRVS